MKNKYIQSLAAAFATLALAPSHEACAQMVDYGSLQALFGEPVTTSAVGIPQRAKDVPADMTILTAEDIRRSGSRNIPEILKMVPGVDVLRTGTQAYDVGIRGVNRPFSNRLLVLINGRQVFLDDYSRTNWNALPLNVDEIRQIEVVKGPNAALFGNNAIDGVINIITFNPLYDKMASADVIAGTQHTAEADATVSRQLSESGGLKVSAGGFNADAFDTSRSPTQQAFTRDPAKRYVSGNGVVRLNATTEMELESSYVKSQQSGADVSNTFYNSTDEISSFRGGVTSQTDYGLIKANAYFNHNITTNADTINPSTVDITNDLVVAQLEDEFKAGSSHTFRIAGEYRDNMFDYFVTQSIPQSPKIEMHQASISGMWNWQISNAVALTNAVRAEQWHLQQDGTLWSGAQYGASDYNKYINNIDINSGLVWHATGKDTVRLLYGRGVQFPSFYEAGYYQTEPYPGVPGLVISFQGNPALHPTIVNNYEVDYDRKIDSLFSTFRAAAFYQESNGLMGLASSKITSFPNVYISGDNLGNTQSGGVEIGLNGSKDRLRWGISDSFAYVSADAAVEDQLHLEKSAPQNNLKGNLGYSVDAWEFDGLVVHHFES